MPIPIPIPGSSNDSDSDDDYLSSPTSSTSSSLRATIGFLTTTYKNRPLVRAMQDSGMRKVRAVMDHPDTIVEAPDLFAAVFTASTPDSTRAKPRFLPLLLDTGISPNIRMEDASPPTLGVLPDWQDHDVGVTFGSSNEHEWYPIQKAARLGLNQEFGFECAGERRLATIRLLLSRGADPYLEFRQHLRVPSKYPFPGHEPTSDEEKLAFGTRTILHSLFEDGEQTLPFFDSSFHLHLEHRDAQGRTIIQSLCQSRMGPDLPIGATICDRESPRWAGLQSMFHDVRLRGADMLAVHYSERTLLHHLLGPKRYSVNFPMMNDTLQWVIDHHPEFMNRPDKFGTYPIHLALQQLAYCPHLAYPDGYQGSPTFKVGIDQLLAAGADPHVRDGRGNTVLHYVIMAAPTDKRAGEPVRQLLRQFIDMGVDVNLRNHAGWTPFTGVLASWERPNLFEFWRTNLDVPPRDGTDDIDHEVLTMFDEAGADWTMKYSQEQTLLHLLFRAGEGVERATCRARYLLTKSVDPTLHDDNGLSVEDWSITI